jgi:beta-fructofuranosidase
MNVDLGIAHVYIDDVFVAEIDCYSPIGGAQQLFTKSDLTDGMHTIRIVRTDDKNPLSSGYNIVHDYFKRFWRP